jgi:hypothetical protein
MVRNDAFPLLRSYFGLESVAVLTVSFSFFCSCLSLCRPHLFTTSCKCFFLETYVDPTGRSNVHRHLVCVSIPIITSNAVLGHEVKDMIIASVRTAIQHGVFKLLA